MKARRSSRQRMIQALYEYRVNGAWGSLDALRESFDQGADDHLEEDEEFTLLLGRTVAERLEEIDSHIQGASHNWRPERMSAVDHCVLRLATAELLLGTAPPRVVLNEAVELARLYGSESSAAFVNGVLDGVWRAIRKDTSGQ